MWRPVYQFAVQILVLTSVWSKIFLVVILKQIVISILILTLLLTAKFKIIKNKSFHRISLILSGDISFNPGPVYNSQSSYSNEWNVFKAKGIQLIQLNVSSLLPKTDEIRYIAAHTNVAII